MNEPTHTPAPWKAVLDPYPTAKNIWLVEKRQDGWKTLIAEVYADPDHNGGPQWQGTKEANARLIAAAPDLLEALKHCLVYDCKGSETLGRQKALAAIAKAQEAKAA